MVPKPRIASRTPNWLRAIGIALGVFFLVWLPVEDVDNKQVLLLALGVSGWLTTRYYVTRKPQLVRSTLAGGIAGLTVAPLAAFLMIFKGGLHDHGFPDFAISQISAVISGMPWWLLGGLMVGFGIGLLKSYDLI